MKRILFILCVGISACCADIVLPPYVGDGRILTTSKDVPSIEQDVLKLEPASIPYTALQRQELPTSAAITHTAIATSSDIPAADQIQTVQQLETQPIQLSDIVTDSIKDRLAIGAELVRNVRKKIIDQYSLSNDPSLFRENRDILEKWMDIYEQDWPCTTVGMIPTDVRMIAEVRLPRNKDQAVLLYDNLMLRKQEGYNAVLLTFAGTESSDYLMALALYLKDMGFNVWFAFGGPESIKAPVYIDPDQYMDYLLKLAAVCDGFISHWRRTSSHLLIQDQQFMDFTAAMIHSVNPAMPILGELFFGPTAMNAKRLDWVVQVPGSRLDGQVPQLIPRKATCAGGYVITNLSTANVNVKSVLSTLLAAFRGSNYVVITGPRIYYLTNGTSGTTYEEDRATIVALEQRWKAAGIAGTITLHGDGSEGTDNMSLYKNPKYIKKVQQ